MKLVHPSQTLALLRQFGFHSSRALGQNFLVDENILNKILTAAELKKTDIVLEIGAGIGSLTVALAEKVQVVVAVELDKRLWPILQKTTSACQNCFIKQMDAMKLELEQLKVNQLLPNKMVSNLPYSIAAPLLISYLTKFNSLKTYLVMVQREIAARILAKPKTKVYGAYTVKLALLATAELMFLVPRTSFMPVPNVDSAVVKLVRRSKLPKNLAWVFKIVDTAFRQRRKRVVNALAVLGFKKQELAAVIKSLGHQETARAEELTAADYLKLSSFLTELAV